MVSMGNTCCLQIYRSGNMKSTVSSSSSGSEKVGGSGVVSSLGYDLDETKSKSTSRMSCASDDSCAINELLEGRMDLNIKLPNTSDCVVFNVERRTPMLDLLVNIATRYRFNAANYTINAGDHEFKASTPIGSLDVNQISIIPKPTKTGSLKSGPSVIPFQTTFRLQVNLPRNQLMVLRVSPNSSIAAIKQIICSEKSLESSKYQLVRFVGNSEAPQILESSKSLAFYTINEVTLVSNKTLAQIEMQFGAATTSQVDLSASRTSSGISANKKAIHSLLISQSNPDFATIDDKAVLNHAPSAKSVKKRPAPPPPMPSSGTLPNNVVSAQMNGHKNENNLKNDSVIKTAVSEAIIETKPQLSKNVVNHVRQNSGSDSSGYHESVLSSDSPESSSAVATLPKSSSTTATISSTNTKLINNKAQNKKRRAPPPPQSQHLNINQDYDNRDKDENKVAVECMSDVSLPLSISSSSASDSSGTASSINNRSLSPIVITQTNGSSTPRRTSMNSTQVPSTSTSSQLDDRPEEPVSTPTHVSDVNSSQSEKNAYKSSGDEEVTHSEAIIVNSDHIIVDEESSTNKLQESIESSRSEPILCQQNDNLDIKGNNDNNNETSIIINDTNDCEPNKSSASITAKSASELLPKEVEVSCTAPALALAVSHDNDLSGHECVEQVEERDISNIINNEKQGSIVMPIISPPLQFVDGFVHYSKPVVSGTANNCLHANSGSGSYPSIFKSSVRSYLDSIRRAYLHDMKGDGNLKLQLTGVNQLNSTEMSDNSRNEYKSDQSMQNLNELELAEMSLPLPPPSPFQNSNHEEPNSDSSLHECDDETTGRGLNPLNDSTSESNTTINETISDKRIIDDQLNESPNDSPTMAHISEDTIDALDSTPSDSNESKPESEMKTTTPLIVSEEDKLNKEIEVTLQSFNDELDRHELEFEIESKDLNNEQSIREPVEANYVINATNDNEVLPNTQKVNKVSVQVQMETIKSVFEGRQTPSPTPRILSSVNGKSKLIINGDDTQTKVSKLSNGKTTFIVNKRDTPSPPPSPQPPSISPTPSNEEKFTAEEVRQLCRPRVKLTNFSIGSYKKDVDIFEETQRSLRSEMPATAPVISGNTKPTLAAIKPLSMSASVEEKSVPIMNPSKSKVNITAKSTTATTTSTAKPSTAKPSTPVIQTLITTAPKINRIQSWSGQKSVSLDRRDLKQAVKTNERYISQISVNKDSKSFPEPQQIETDEDLKSPNLVVQTLIAQIKSRSPSPKDLPQKSQSTKEHTMISIKPGSESVIKSHSKSQSVSGIMPSKEVDLLPTKPQNHSQQSFTIGKTKVQLKSTPNIKSPIQSTQPSIIDSNQPTMPPPVPPPIPPPMPLSTSTPIPPPMPLSITTPRPPPPPQNISSFSINNNNNNNNNSSKVGKTNANPKIFLTKGWNSDKVKRNGEVPKVKHVEPPNSGVDVRDALLNEIKSFGGKNSLKKVSKNTSWRLEINTSSVKT